MFVGNIIITPKAEALIPPDEVQAAIKRYAANDFGEIDEEQRLANQQNLKKGKGHIVALYRASNGRTFVVFAPLRSAITGVLLSQEYSSPTCPIGWVC